jgi:hypothetical protein
MSASEAGVPASKGRFLRTLLALDAAFLFPPKLAAGEQKALRTRGADAGKAVIGHTG